MAEYALPIAIVAMTALLVLTKGNFFENMKQYTGATNHGTLQDGQLKIGQAGNIDSSLIQNDEELKQYYMTEGISFVEGNTACFADTGCLNFPNIRGGAVAEVDGTLGETTARQYSKLLLELAQNLKEKGAPDALSNLVERLGQSGMGIGNKIMSFHRGVEACNGSCGTTSISHNSQMQKMELINNFRTLQERLKEYLKQNPTAKESFASVLPIVNTASGNIIQASTGWGDYAGVDGVIYVPMGRLVKSNATTICQTVNGNTACPIIKKK